MIRGISRWTVKMANSLQRSDGAVHPLTEAAYSQMDNYLRHLVCNLQEVLKDNLLAVYLLGSAGAGAYQPGISDVDVYGLSTNQHWNIRGFFCIISWFC